MRHIDRLQFVESRTARSWTIFGELGLTPSPSRRGVSSASAVDEEFFPQAADATSRSLRSDEMLAVIYTAVVSGVAVCRAGGAPEARIGPDDSCAGESDFGADARPPRRVRLSSLGPPTHPPTGVARDTSKPGIELTS